MKTMEGQNARVRAQAVAPLTLSVDEASALLGVSRSTGFELVNSGALRSLRINRRVLVPRDAVEAFLLGSGYVRGGAAVSADTRG